MAAAKKATRKPAAKKAPAKKRAPAKKAAPLKKAVGARKTAAAKKTAAKKPAQPTMTMRQLGMELAESQELNKKQANEIIEGLVEIITKQM